MVKCSNCGNEIKEGTKFCSKCGNNILEQREKSLNKTLDEKKTFGKMCVNCGMELEEGSKFCPKCGSKVMEENDQKQVNEDSQQKTDTNNEAKYKYTRPEKVRFSERWLLVKL